MSVTTGTSRITLCLSARARIALAAITVLGLGAAGCGGDDEETARAPETVPADTAPAPVTTPPPETTPQKEKRDPDTEPRTVPPEEQQGDEEAIRSEAVFTGRAGRLTPREIRVPGFIAVRVILRSADADGTRYSLRIGGQRLAIGPGRAVAEAELDGLLPNKAYAGTSPQGNVRVVASAEPGP
jgi:hypothetical protein